MVKSVSKIIFREDLYPRFEANQALIQRYSDITERLLPIKVNQDNILIDGFHRWKAYQLAGRTDITINVIKTISEKEIYQFRKLHYCQYSGEIKSFLMQVPFLLPVKDKNGERKRYCLDFMVVQNDGQTEYIEVEGKNSSMDKWKRRMVEVWYGIKIQIVD